jgi:hypothetical protein
MNIEYLSWGALTSADQIAFSGEPLVILGPRGELVFERAHWKAAGIIRTHDRGGG